MEFLIILFLLVLNGIFAMYEIALVSSSKARLETLVAKGNKSARGVLKQLEETNKPETEKQAEKDLSVFYSELETRLKDILGAKISIKAKNNGKGKIEIDYYSQDELDRITEMLYSINR